MSLSSELPGLTPSKYLTSDTWIIVQKSEVSYKAALGGVVSYLRTLAGISPGGAAYQGALVARTLTPQTIAHNTVTPISWDTVVYDTNSMFSGGSPTRITIPVGVTRVRAYAVSRYAVDPDSDGRLFTVYKNNAYAPGLGVVTSKDTGAFFPTADMSYALYSAVVSVSPGDYFELMAAHFLGVGKTLDVVPGYSCWMCVEIVETT